MKNLITAIFLSSLMFGTPVIAGSGHDHDEDGGHSHSHAHESISGDEAAVKASKKIEQLIKKGKLDASWAGLKAASVEKKSYAKGPEWLIIFKNDKVTDMKKRTLYLFFSMDGHYIAANYTGI